MSGSNCCFLTCTQVSQEIGKVVWYSHLWKNFLQFVVIHTTKDFSVVNEAEVDVFLEFSCFPYDPTDAGNRTMNSYIYIYIDVSPVVQLLSCVQLFGTLWTAAR